MTPPIKITRISHQTDLGPTGSVRKLVRIDFMIGDDGPFNRSYPESDFDQAAAFADISNFADSLQSLRTKAAAGTA